MPSNLQEFGNTPNTAINKSESISSIPSYLRKNKQVFNADIANYEYNSDASNVDSVILAMGEGHLLNSSNVSYKLGVYSSFVLGRKGYNNRWDASYQDSENFLLSYFDGSSYFKRLTIDYVTGNLKTRTIDLRGGNTPNCNAYSQLAFGASGESSFEDYSQYRHNFRTSHTAIADLNNENAIDIYLWDANNDTPDELGSRHVLRLNALGNEELISGFRIDGGLAVPVTTTQNKNDERDNYAIPGKGVLYYNTISNTFRFSQNGGLFKEIGDASASPIVNIPATQIAIGNGATGLTSSSALTFSGGNLNVTGGINATNLHLSSLFNGLVASSSGTLVQATFSDIPGISVAPNQVAYGAAGSGITSSGNLTFNGSALGLIGNQTITGQLTASGNVTGGNIIAVNNVSGATLTTTGNGTIGGTITVSSLGAGTSLVKSVAGVLSNASASDVLAAISISVANTQVAIGNGTGLTGYPALTYSGGVFVNTGSATVGGTLTVSGLSGMVAATAGVLRNALISDLPGISVSPNQVAYGASVSGITSSANFLFDGNTAIINNTSTNASTLSIIGGIPSIYVPGGSSSYGLGVHVSAKTPYGPTIEFSNGTTNWIVNNDVNDIFKISRGSVSCISHNYSVCTIRGNVDANNLYLHRQYVSVASEGDSVTLAQNAPYWIIPTGSAPIIVKLPANPIDLTTFCIFHRSASSFISRIEGNGKLIIDNATSGIPVTFTNGMPYLATIFMFDSGTDIWYCFKGQTG